MSIHNAKKIGFYTALAMTIGTIIGIGIFLKNISIVRNQTLGAPEGYENTFSFWSMIISWVVAAIISLCAAISFAEISTCRSSKCGLSGWIDQLTNPKIGKFIRPSHNNFYYSLLTASILFLSVEGLYNAIDTGVNGTSGNVHFGYVFLGAVLIFASLLLLNIKSIKGSAYFANVAIFLKMIPIVLVGVVGLINANNSNILDATSTSTNSDVIATPSTQWFSVEGMFIALPAILFSFDSFLCVGNLATDIKKPQKNIPLVVIFAIVISAIIYIIIAIGAGLTGIGSAGGILKTLFNIDDHAARSAIDITINVFITISAIGVCNSLVTLTLRSSEGLIERGHIMGWRKLSQYKNGGLFLMIISVGFYLIGLGIPATIINDDAIIDGASNAPIIMYFLIYGITILINTIDRYTKKQAVRIKGYMICAPIAIIGTFATFAYQFFYNNLALIIINPNGISTAGGFFTQGTLVNYEIAIIFWVLTLWFVGFPLINYFVIKKTDGYKNNDALDFHNHQHVQISVIKQINKK